MARSYALFKTATLGTLLVLGSQAVALAQLIPDNTLGAENSVVQQLDAATQLIEGGAARGGNLFHSFTEFNVTENHGVYFANPAGIDSILSRVTGNTPSNIFGQLGVLGNAGLFLLNPNGFVFGENATLDVNGAFHAIAAPALPLGNGVFSAVAPQSSSLLTISPDVSLFNYLTSGDITSTAQLQAGQNLTLAADNLQLQGQLVAGDDLNLLATDTVTVRDTASEAFVASAVGDLTIQGNQGIDIWTLQHLDQTPFVSGGDLTLISDGVISADAHFEGGGNLQFLTLGGDPGNIVSFYDPIIYAIGDVVFGDYTGVALKVEVTGSIQAGDIRITGPDTTFTPDGSGSDEDLLASSRAAILRAGVSVATGNIPQTTGGAAFANGAAAGQPPGSIVVSTINTSDEMGGDGGPIVLAATGNIVTTGSFNDPFLGDPVALGSYAYSVSGNVGTGGAITLSSQGNIDILGSLNAFSNAFVGASGDSESGGAITLSSQGNIDISGNLNAYSRSESGDSGPGGAITLSSQGNIDISGELSSSSFSRARTVGAGGAITLSSQGNIDISGALSSSSFSFTGTAGTGGAITLSSQGNIDISGELSSSSFSFLKTAGTGGAITLSSAGNIDISGQLTSSSSSPSPSSSLPPNSISFLPVFSDQDSGSGGAITLSSAGNIDISGELFSASASNSLDGDSGPGGAITLSSQGNIDISGELSSTSFSNSGAAGTGGAITLTSEGNIGISGQLSSPSFSLTGTASTGGDIALDARQGNILGIDGSLITLTTAAGGDVTGNGGAVRLDARDQISGLEVVTPSSNPDAGSRSGNVTIQGWGDLLVANVELQTSADVQIPDPLNPGQTITVIIGGLGQSGNAALSSLGNLTLDTVNIRSDANGPVPGGNITIENVLKATLTNTTLTTDTAGQGAAGNIFVRDVGALILRNNSVLLAEARGGMDGGNISINNTDFVVAIPGENSDIIANAVGGTGGRVEIDSLIFGLNPILGLTTIELRANGTNDISASSEFGQDGTVSTPGLGVNPNEGSDALADGFVSPDDLIASSCIARGNQVEGSFLVTGSGGLPYIPDDSANSVYTTGDVQLLSATSGEPETEGWQLGDVIVEPEIAAQLADGRIVLGRSCT